MNGHLWDIGRRWIPAPLRAPLKKFLQPAFPIASTLFPENRLHWIDPALITHCCADSSEDTTEFNIYSCDNKTIPGDWDMGGRQFKELDIYVSTQMRLEDISWQQTPFYARIARIIQSGQQYYGCSNLEALNARCLKWDSMIQSMKDEGYKPHINPIDQIAVNVGRDGRLLFNNGRHRLAAAQLLRLPAVAIRVTARHPEWAAFKSEMLAYAAGHNDEVYAPLLHPDLEDIPHLHTHERYEIISAALPNGVKTLLDIGAHWGYFPILFTQEGFECTAVEYGNRNYRMMQKMMQATNTHFNTLNCDIFTVSPLKYDVVLALSIFHHFLLKGDKYANFLALLRRLDCQVLFVEMHNPAENQMQDAYMKLEPSELADLISRESCLKQHERIGETEDNGGTVRSIYRFWRE